MTRKEKCLYDGSDKRLCTIDKCDSCYNLSFASHEKSKFLADENIDARRIFKGSNKKYTFVCSNNECNHKFEASLDSVTSLSYPTWCPFCANNRLCGNINCNVCTQKSFASHEKSQFWSKDNQKKPYEVSKYSSKKFKFDCDICNHQFMGILNPITMKNTWCPFCASKQLCHVDTCLFCFNKSFASHEKSKYWSKNNEIMPREIFLNRNQKYKFDCDVCKHQFMGSLCNINQHNHWCPFCSGHELCCRETCSFCYNRSFATHEKSKYWSKNNVEKPHEVFKTTQDWYKFDCDVCSHEFSIPLYTLASNHWCGFCKGALLCANTCDLCYNKSFASHEKSQFWSKKNQYDPRYIKKHSNKMATFDCPLCNQEYVSSISRVSSGCRCDCSKTKTETKLFKFLIEKWCTVSREVKFNWCKNIETGRHLPFDFVIDIRINEFNEYNNILRVIIELDGPHHFKDMIYWKSLNKDQRERDIYKMKRANEQKI
jgi:hypothetical protein